VDCGASDKVDALEYAISVHALSAVHCQPNMILIHSDISCRYVKRVAQAVIPCAVPEANYVTAYWVELSEKEMKPVRELGHKRVTCAPLPYHLPLPGMSAVKYAACIA